MKLTLRIERADGQFTVAQTDIPDVLPGEVLPGNIMAVNALEDRILRGFWHAYRNCADLPS